MKTCWTQIGRMMVLTAMATALSAGAVSEVGSKPEERPTQVQFTPDPKLPNVLILGDSISIGYLAPLRKELTGKANVYRPVDPKNGGPENCESTLTGLKNIDRWLGDTKWTVIHFNFGLHDLKHVTSRVNGHSSGKPEDPRWIDPDQYVPNLEKLVVRLKQTGAHLIFATTTPVPEGLKGFPFRVASDVPLYNDAALAVMKKNGVTVDDLYALCLPRLAQMQRKKNVHFTEAGSVELAKAVARSIEPELAKTP